MFTGLDETSAFELKFPHDFSICFIFIFNSNIKVPVQIFLKLKCGDYR
jgi:hypothetical protein